MPVIARYEFDETNGPYFQDSATENGNQPGYFMNTATAEGGRLVLDGTSGFGKIFPSDVFQLDRGTLDVQFSMTSGGSAPQTIVSRDSLGNSEGSFRVEVLPDGSLRSTHETGDDSFVLHTPPGFISPGDEVRISYSWDMGGEGGRAVAVNLTTGQELSADVPNTLGMDMGGQNQPWLIGAGQQQVTPGDLAQIDQHFHGSFDHVTISDSVDNGGGVVPCFTAGTRIMTPQGLRRVEDLRPGDAVITRDSGSRPVVWIGQRRLDRIDLGASPALQPVLIRKGAFGPDQPERDLMVSPNHRMMIANSQNPLHFVEPELLVAAKLLVNGTTVVQAQVEAVTYVHILFDQHELVLTEGSWSESFQPGAYTLGQMGAAQRAEILALFPELADADRPPIAFATARRSLTRHEAALLRV